MTRVDAEDEPISYVGAQTTDMTLEQLSWYIDNTVAKRLLGPAGHRRRRAASAASIAHPRDPRSRRAPGAGDHRRAGQSAASPEQHERRRRTRRDRRFGAVGPRARQRPGRLRAVADADRAARRPLRQARRPRRGEGQQFRAALDRQDERAPGRHIHSPAGQGLVRSDRLRRRLEGNEEAREGKPQGPLLRGVQHASTTPRRSTGRRWKG